MTLLSLPTLDRAAAGKLAVRVGLVALAVFATYLVAGNVLLSGGRLGKLLSENPDKLRVQYVGATTWWPGRVHVDGLDVRVRDRVVEWELHVDGVDASISLFALLGHRLHASPVHGVGVSYRARLRLRPDQVSAGRVARDPAIDGFPPIPLIDVPPDVQIGEHTPWGVELEGIDAPSVREIWVDGFRLAGDMGVRGAVSVPPGGLVVSPSHLEVREAALTTGDDPIVTGVHGGVDLRIDPVRLGDVKGVEVLRFFTTASALEGRFAGVAFLRDFVDPAVSLAGGAGPFTSTLVVEGGVVKKGSASHVELGTLTLGYAGRRLEARATAETKSTEDDAGPAGHVSIALASVALFEPKQTDPAVTVPAMTITARVPEADLAVTPRDFQYTWDVPRAEIADLRVLDEAFGHEAVFRIEGGKATSHTRGSGSMHGLAADAGLVGIAKMDVHGAHASAGVDVKGRVRADFDAGKADLSGSTADLTGLAVRDAAAGAPDSDMAHGAWWARSKLEAAEVRVSPPSFTAKIAGSCRDGRPLLALYSAMKDTSAALTLALTVLPDALIESATAGAHGGGTLAVTAGGLSLHGVDVRGASSAMRMELERRGDDHKTGGLLVEAGPAVVGVAFEGASSHPILIGARTWFDTHIARAQPASR